jgi:hypothetical protein
MSSRITRDQTIEAIRELPPDASVDGAIERFPDSARMVPERQSPELPDHFRKIPSV